MRSIEKMLHIQFIFRGKICTCSFLIDCSAYPGYIFIFIADKEVIAEFSEEVTIKTDFVKLLSKKDDYPALVTLRQAILDAISPTPECIAAAKKFESAPYRAPEPINAVLAAPDHYHFVERMNKLQTT